MKIKSIGIPSKYGNRKTEIDGITFASRKEANRYNELKLLQKAGDIEQLELQPRYTLQEAFKDKKGILHRKIEYVADFSYGDKTILQWVVEDCKGMQTEVYKLKKKLFLYKYRDFEFLES